MFTTLIPLGLEAEQLRRENAPARKYKTAILRIDLEVARLRMAHPELFWTEAELKIRSALNRGA